MQLIFLLLVNIVIVTSARIVSLDEFDDNLIELSLLKRQEPEYVCKDSPVELGLIIDSSRSIYEFDFKKQIDFLVKFVTIFDIDPSHVRVAAVSFGMQVILQGAFNFNKYNSTKEVQDGLRRITYRGGEYGEGTNTALAIAFMRKRIFRNARPDAKKLCIVLTDGRSTDPKKTQEEAALIKKDDVQMVAIGIGNRISIEELKGIASSADFVFTVDNHSLLNSIKRQLILKVCTDVEIVTSRPPSQKDEDTESVTTEAPLQQDESKSSVTKPKELEKTTVPPTKAPVKTTPTPSKPPVTPSKDLEPLIKKGCKGPIDINFVFNPAQVGTRRIIKFIENSVSSKALEKDDVRVGIITAPFPDVTGFRLNRYNNKKEIKKHFDEFGTNIVAPQLADLRLEAFLRINGGRPYARKVGILFVRGKIDDALETIIEAKATHAAGIEIYTIAIGDAEDRLIINNIATNRNYVMNVPSSNDLPDLSDEFVKLICEKAN